ncbi:MAG: hypothetical protein Q7K26_03725 [bacterium]|nr:hypothetical protein [bacterium]
MKELKRNSWAFKIAYGANSKIPARVGRCALFRKVVSMLLIWWPILALFSVVIIVLGTVFAFLISGYRLNIMKCYEEKEPAFIPIKHWPAVGGHRAWPGYLIFGGIALYLTPGLIGFIFGMISQYVSLLGIVVAGVIALVLIFYFARWFRTTEVRALFKDHLRDIKEGFCPMIPIEPASTDEKKD